MGKAGARVANEIVENAEDFLGSVSVFDEPEQPVEGYTDQGFAESHLRLQLELTEEHRDAALAVFKEGSENGENVWIRTFCQQALTRLDKRPYGEQPVEETFPVNAYIQDRAEQRKRFEAIEARLEAADIPEVNAIKAIEGNE